MWLGATVDTETDGQPTTGANGDDSAGIDDEDGIVARPSWTTGAKLQFQVQVSSSAAASGLYLGVWIDWNKSGGFETAAFGSGGEMYRVAVNTGTNTLELDAPSGFSGDPALEFRLRLYAGDPGTPLPTGPTPNGEVEDYVYSLSPLAVTLANFEAMQVDNYVLLTWETNSELNNRGFNLWRGTSPAGPDTRLNDTLIPSQSQGNPGGFTYTWEDRVDLVLGTTYYYWVDDVDLWAEQPAMGR